MKAVRDEPDVCVEWSSQINKAAVLMRDSVPAEDLTVCEAAVALVQSQRREED